MRFWRRLPFLERKQIFNSEKNKAKLRYEDGLKINPYEVQINSRKVDGGLLDETDKLFFCFSPGKFDNTLVVTHARRYEFGTAADAVLSGEGKSDKTKPYMLLRLHRGNDEGMLASVMFREQISHNAPSKTGFRPTTIEADINVADNAFDFLIDHMVNFAEGGRFDSGVIVVLAIEAKPFDLPQRREIAIGTSLSKPYEKYIETTQAQLLICASADRLDSLKYSGARGQSFHFATHLFFEMSSWEMTLHIAL